MNEESNDRSKEDLGKVIKFPTLQERDSIRNEEERRKKQRERAWRALYQAQKRTAHGSFFNFGRVGVFTRTILCLYVLMFIPLAFMPDLKFQIFMQFGFVPAYFTAYMSGDAASVPFTAPLGIFTYAFLHADFMHLVFNAVMSLVFGIMVEEAFGTKRTAIMFVVCSVAGAILHFCLMPDSLAPVVGASSAISGLFGISLLLLYRQGRMGMMSARGPWPMIGVWIGIMVVVGLLTPGNIAWIAHLGGFLTGVGLYQFTYTR